MPRALRFLEKINRKYANLSIICLTVAALWIDFITSREIQFPLVYVIPVALAAWRKQRILAYVMAVMLPVLRIGFEFQWNTNEFAFVGINALIEIAAMLFYAYLVGRIAAQTTQLKNTITAREQKISQLRAFARMTGTTLHGHGLSPGLAEGNAWIYLPTENKWPPVHQSIARDDVEAEINRLDRALAVAIRELDDTRRHLAGDMAAAESAVLEVHLAMLADAGFLEPLQAASA